MALWFCLALTVRAQWETQTFQLTQGWNAIYLNIDASYDTIDHIIGGNPNYLTIREIWRWNPPNVAAQFLANPATPLASSTEWTTWYRQTNSTDINSSSFSTLTGNAAYLVKVDAATTLSLIGKPLAPSLLWSQSGLNLVGFSTPTNAPPTFMQFFQGTGGLGANETVWVYPGPDPTKAIPQSSLDIDLSQSPVQRGQAQWVAFANSPLFSGPFSVVLPGSTGLNFPADTGQITFHVRNSTDSQQNIRVQLLASEPDPVTGVTAALPPLLLRGPLTNLVTHSYTYTDLAHSGSSNIPTYLPTLAPQGQSGADRQVVVGINRFAMANYDPGTLFAGVLRLSDDTGLLQIDLPVSATQATNTGLWVGTAVITNVVPAINNYYLATSVLDVSNILSQFQLTNMDGEHPQVLVEKKKLSPNAPDASKLDAVLSYSNSIANYVQDFPALLAAYDVALAIQFATSTNSDRSLTNYQIDPNSSRIIAQTSTGGHYLSSGPLLQTNTSVPRTFPLRLIVHNDDKGSLRILQRVYLGQGMASNSVVALSQTSLDSTAIASARRISAIHLPYAITNTGWSTTGQLALGQRISFPVSLAYDDQESNPFLHTYHPDHDNLNASFSSPLSVGDESFTIDRLVTLDLTGSTASDFSALTSTALMGVYREAIALTGKANSQRTFNMTGYFSLNRISPISALTP